MKSIIICLILLLNQHVLMAQLVPYLWNENLQLKKEQVEWVEKTTHVTEIEEGNKVEYLLSKVEIGKDGKRTVTIYDEAGKVRGVNVGYFETEFKEILEIDGGDKEIKTYDKNENLISEVWVYAHGAKDEKIFTYEDNKLVKIVEKDIFDTMVEVLKYKDDKLSQILSLDASGELLMERKILYDREGKITETQRIQEGEINKNSLYTYNEENQLVLKEEAKINRWTGEKMPPEIYEYSYHDNGVMKEEKWTTYKDESKGAIKYLLISVFNELGLEIKGILKDYANGFEEITRYEYKMKEK